MNHIFQKLIAPTVKDPFSHHISHNTQFTSSVLSKPKICCIFYDYSELTLFGQW